ncbi:MAG TPA: ABC transporter substrate-binding protein [Gemmatimonadales bacterium]|nr:ABC transporter substrate-binding protein [Gemmatimonadales bacterium]
MIFTRARVALLLLGVAACASGERPASRTVVVAAVGEPPSVLPPLTYESVGRDVGDLVWERLATLAPHGASIDTAAYRPALAGRWERMDSLTWRFHLRPGARWQDGVPVTARDVVFSFDVYADSTIDAIGRMAVAPLQVSAADSSTVLIRFPHASPEQLYDATYHVRIIPEHVWSGIARDAWGADTAVAHLVGSGPFRVVSWRRGEALVLSRASSARRIDTVVFRFAQDPDAALNLLLSHEADLLEVLMTPDRIARVEADTAFRVERYPSAVYGFIAFNLAGKNPALRNREVRRALASAVDRDAIAQNAFGPDAHAPAGPMSALAWVGEAGIDMMGLDTASARVAVGRAAARPYTAAPRPASRVPRPSFDILVPSTSPSRRRIAEALQEAWRRIGVTATITAVDFPVFQERLASGKFDSYIGAYLDEPTMRGLAEQWGRAGFESQNYGHYDNPAVDSLLALAASKGDTGVAGPLYRQALSLLNADAPAIFLYTPMNASAFRRDIGNVTIDPYSWLAGLGDWTR